MELRDLDPDNEVVMIELVLSAARRQGQGEGGGAFLMRHPPSQQPSCLLKNALLEASKTRLVPSKKPRLILRAADIGLLPSCVGLCIE